MSKTNIPYADEAWNTVVGCTPIGEGCKNCWAVRTARRLSRIRHTDYYRHALTDGQWNGNVFCLNCRLDTPLHWRKPRTVFVNSMSDTFHEKVPCRFITRMLDRTYETQQHTYLFFTKRYQRASEYLTEMAGHLDNVRVFFSISTQAELANAMPYLIDIPVKVKGISLEPLLGPVRVDYPEWIPHLQQVIVGCESGPNRRPCKLEWIRSIVQQCQQAGVAPYVKQIPVWRANKLREAIPKVSTDPSEWPADLRVQEWVWVITPSMTLEEGAERMTTSVDAVVRLRRCRTCDRCTACDGQRCELGYETRDNGIFGRAPMRPCPKPLTLPEYIRLRKLRQANNSITVGGTPYRGCTGSVSDSERSKA